MKKSFKVTKPIMLIAISIIFTITQSNGQQIKPSASGYAPVNGIKVYYEVYGEGRPIVLLHGAFMTIEGNWGQIIPELSKTRKVIAIEMQGHGHTPYSDRPLTHANMATDVEGVMDYLKVDSADIVGYSMGGSVAYKFAIQSPKRVTKLVIISSTYKSSGWLPEVTSGFKSFKPEFFNNTPMHTAYDAVAPDKTKWTKFIEQMIAFASQPFDFGDDNVAKIKAPVLIIAGDNDGLNKVELARTYKLLGGGVTADMGPMPKSHLAVVPAQSHVSLMMQTNTILGYLNGFLK
ncbi:alpha/beta fold hydrolase [Mucilaginibacter sp. L3T2-6]|uniref:alpha/beta fold hydrolase n=1 Tax=Mucilaginibacter sp. L3T2-6 TaxID=3062491 RepID=UPI002675CBE6|nr:alpha/beta hydrolase [Mucilaginibacter sp. L3T2-6]MDO3645273.1 alpha/beta hydrolase [Mucilaginibacter sp. L3T2-6]MDV6217725.1 alpha/beta hydrolase [Mucilaginibacter sp. L3T2-6]